MNTQQQHGAVDRVLTLVRQSGMVETDPVDFVEFLLTGIGTRDLDAITEDILTFVLRMDDLRHHVRDRLDVQLAFKEGHADAPAADPRIAADAIVRAIDAIVIGHVADHRRAPAVVANVRSVDANEEGEILREIARHERERERIPRALPHTRMIQAEVK